MPLNQATRIALARLLGHLRDDWLDAGTHDACVKLAGMDGDPFQLCAQAITQAAVAANRVPECVTWPVKPGRTHIPTPKPPRDACPTHDAEGYHTSGMRICCYLEQNYQEGAVTSLRRADRRTPQEREHLRRLAGVPPMAGQTRKADR